jgi:hypothetical protein
MKKTITFVLLLVIVISFGTISCSKKKGDLIVNVVDGLNNPLGSGHTVYLFYNEADFNNGAYSETSVTNNAGQVTFFKLDPGTYYAGAEYENWLGLTNTATGSGSVSAGYVTTITIK